MQNSIELQDDPAMEPWQAELANGRIWTSSAGFLECQER